LSISTAITFFEYFASSSVNVPIPGPISTIISSFVISAAFIVLQRTWLSIKKFCPKFFLKLKLYLFTISFVLKARVVFIKKPP